MITFKEMFNILCVVQSLEFQKFKSYKIVGKGKFHTEGKKSQV